ncbi:MAG: hypothetical protein ACP5O1_08380, partial [Phycisphaerae bacterium]
QWRKDGVFAGIIEALQVKLDRNDLALGAGYRLKSRSVRRCIGDLSPVIGALLFLSVDCR